MAEEVVFTVKDLAKYLHVHPITIYRYLRKNKLPAFRIGNCWRFNKESIDLWRLNQENIGRQTNSPDCSDK